MIATDPQERPSSAQNTDPLDAALMLAGLRGLYRDLRERAEASPTPETRRAYTEAMRGVQRLVDEVGGVRRAWETLRQDLVAAIERERSA